MSGKEFLMREISFNADDIFDHDNMFSKLEVIRSRNSSGHKSITLRIDDKQFSLTGDHYEQAAKDIAALLEMAADEPCLLPETVNAHGPGE